VIEKIVFAKMHGLGNDFIIIDRQDLPDNCNEQELAIQIANRRSGIGCDQLVIYHKEHYYYNMIIYNRDGSSAKACGNASRCLAKLMYERFAEETIILKVSGRKLTCEILSKNEISVNMGQVSFNEDWMSRPEKIWPILDHYMVDPKEIVLAEVGNPHLIMFSNLSNQDKELIGARLQQNELFPDGINVNFASIKENKIYLSVWERGTGFTLACGSGACASFAAAVKLGFVTSPNEVVFKLGSLSMLKDNEDIIMKGPATLVALGEFYYG
jgi:diaminopimelate epimerase